MNDLFTLLGLMIPPRIALILGGVFSALAGVLCVFNSQRVEGLLWRGALLIVGGTALVGISIRRPRTASPKTVSGPPAR
jgi:hypothetical protein